MTDERRHFNRVTFNSPATIYMLDKTSECEIIDLSIHGALVKLNEAAQLEIGANYKLDIPLGGDNKHISVDLQLMHQEDNKLGLMNQQIDIDSITHLRRLVELNSGDSELLDREFEVLIADNQ